MQVAVVHDWLNGMRGGEKVLEAILELFPRSTIYTLFHEKGKVSPAIESHSIVTSWLNRIPGVYSSYRNFLPLFPAAAESLDLSGCDLVISSSHAVAKGVRVGSATHICYSHTPMRYIWDAGEDYAFNSFQRAAMRAIGPRLRRWDRDSAQHVDHFIANSRFVRTRIQEYYGRDSEVIYPPIDTQFFTPQPLAEREDFYLTAGALVPYKRTDLVIEAFNRLGYPLVVAGAGPEYTRLRKMARTNIEFRGSITPVTDDELRRLYRRAKALVVAAREDFGMVAVEARACGCPVIALGAGGSVETIKDGISGILFGEQQTDEIVRAVRRFESLTWPVERVRQQVEAFSREKFKTGIWKFISERIESNPGAHVAEVQPA